MTETNLERVSPIEKGTGRTSVLLEAQMRNCAACGAAEGQCLSKTPVKLFTQGLCRT